MATRVIDIGSRFNNAFGFVGEGGGNTEQTEFEDTLHGGQVYVKDGRSSYENFTIKGNGVTLQFAYSGLNEQNADIFAPPALCSFKSGKRIGQTIVTSNDDQGKEITYGEVVENYGRKPVEITIKGLLIDMVNHQYPSDKVRQFTDMVDWNGPWEVEGQIWRDKKIQTIYFIDWEDGPVQGFMDTWSFTISASSLKPVEYFLKKNK